MPIEYFSFDVVQVMYLRTSEEYLFLFIMGKDLFSIMGRNVYQVCYILLDNLFVWYIIYNKY